jgi:hypothetical protein
LPPGVRIALTAPLNASGTLCVVHAHGGLAGLVARLIFLPPEGEAVNARLELKADKDKVRWLRQFGSMKAESLQTFQNRIYVEEAGPFQMAFRTDAAGERLTHIQVKTYLFGVRVPAFMGPRVDALMSEGPDDHSWFLVVDIKHPWIGTICRYEGVMHAE